MEIKFTDEQQAIIDSRDHNILVSASAGSGKTTVMIRRVLELILDKNHPTPLSNFLIVTFTKASAADMKKKLVDEFLKHQDNPFILDQIDAVETCDISNLHSFCSRLISTYFYEVGIDPSFQVLDEAASNYLKEKALNKLFEQKEKFGDEEFFNLFDIFQKKRQDGQLKKVIERFNDFLNANLDFDEKFNSTLQSAYSTNLSENSCATLINRYVPYQMQKLSAEIENFANFCLDNNLGSIYDYFISKSQAIRSVNLKNSFEVNAKNILSLDFEKSPIVSSKVEIKPQIEEFKKYIRKQIDNYKKNYVSDDIQLLIDGLLSTKRHVVSLYELVKQFNEIYDELKREINALDFNDLEKFALKILENNDILNTIKSKYKYVFVDEYQDINSVQEKIISLVSGENNRFMVGDIKQSIYRFRQCDPDIFMQKYSLYGNGEKSSELHKLNCNFRSDKKILKFVDEVFSDVMTVEFGGLDYKNDSLFVPGESNLDEVNSVNLCYIDTTKPKFEGEKIKGVYSVKNHIQPVLSEEEKAVAEAKIVSDKIARLIAERKDFEFKQVAILVSSRNLMISKFIETLKELNIPVGSDETIDLIKQPMIQEILNFVKYVCNQNDDLTLFKVLKSQLFRFNDHELVCIRKLDKRARFFDCVKLFENLEDDVLREKLRKFNSIIQNFSKLSRLLNMKQLCKKIISEFSLEEINLASNNYSNANLYLKMFIDALPEVSCFDFVFNYSDFSLEVESESSDDCVSVLTIHKSKGMEFKYVFLVNTTNEFNFISTFESVIFNKDLGVGMDYFDTIKRTQIDSVASAGMRLLEKRKLVEEQQRVLYVALTRAIEKLFIICSKDEGKISKEIKQHKKCFCDWFDPIIYNELNGNHNPIINFERYTVSELCEKRDLEKKTLELKYIESQQPNWFKYNYESDVNVPLKSSISKILKTSKNKNDFETEQIVGTKSSAERGIVYHKVFEQIDFKNFIDVDRQIDLIIGKLTDEEREFIDKNKIKNVLNDGVFNEISKSNKILTEKEFYAKVSANLINKDADGFFVLQGIIDLLAIFDDGLIILDYKTGKYNEENVKKYEFQLNTYSDVAERAFNKKVLKKIICFIDEEKIIEI